MNDVASENKNSAAPRVAVVVPSYNHAAFVAQTLRSIFNQTLPPDELLVIDDGSQDDSPRVIEKVLKDCPFPCEFIARPNRGLCATLNEGLEKTGGDYFAYLGSDDLWLAEFLQARVSLLESRPQAVLAYGHTYLIDEQSRVFDSTAEWAGKIYADGDAREMLYAGYAPMSPSVCYRRAALTGVRWNEDARLEDYEFYLALSQSGEFAFDPKILSAWRRHGSNASRDLSFMLEESLEAQARSAPALGWSDATLAKIQKQLRFRYVEEFIRAGDKARARRLYLENLGGAKSLVNFARATARLLVPQSLFQARKRSVWDDNLEKYKDVKIV